MNTVKTDVLIVGGGGAACRAAIAAHDGGAEVLMVLKGRLGTSGATTYEGSEAAGYNAPNPDPASGDSPDVFYDDIITAGLGMADPEVARVLVDEAAPRLRDLEEWGVTFEKKDGAYMTIHGCFSTRRRCFIIKDHGIPIVKALKKQIDARGVSVMEDFVVLSLLVADGACVGAMGLDASGRQTLIDAKAVILATGGAGQIFLNNHNPPDVTGDGYALAYDAGARLSNLEFMQAGVGFIHPVKVGFFCYLWNGLPELRNAAGERFLAKNLPEGVTEEAVMLEHAKHFPFSTRDISKYIEIAVQRELSAGGGAEHGGVILDFSRYTPEYVAEVAKTRDMNLWPITKAYFAERGVDMLTDRIELACFEQCMNGGVKIDARAASSLPGLFAAGEIASGPHGADRLGGNMIMGSQVFGKVAGDSAAEYAKKAPRHGVDAAMAKAQSARTEEAMRRKADVAALDRVLRQTADDTLLIRRSDGSLRRFLDTLESLERELLSSPVSDALNRDGAVFSNKLAAARLVAVSALNRRESRGSHYREDFPDRNDAEFGQPIFVAK